MRPHDKARSVHFVGSFPLASTREVFERVGETVGDLVRRVPDGETGERKDWIVFQRDRLVKLDSLESVGSWRVGKDLVYPLLTPRKGLSASDVAFGSLGYADLAHQSYLELAALKQSGRLPAHVQLQVSLPSPLAIVFCFFAPEVRRSMWPVYERAMRAEVAAIAQAIPHHELAIQWDVAAEIVAVLENPLHAKDWSMQELASGVARAVDFVPADVGE